MKRLLITVLLVAPQVSIAQSQTLPSTERAETLVRSRDFGAARLELSKLILRAPNAVSLRLLQAKVALALEDGAGAEQELKQAGRLGAPSDRTSALLGQSYLLQGAPERALTVPMPRTALAQADLARVRARALYALGRPAEADAAFTRAQQLAPNDPVMWVDVGRYRLAQGNIAEAASAADRAISIAPKDPAVFLFKGDVRRRQIGALGALPWYERGLRVNPRDTRLLNARAAALGDAGKMRAMLAVTRQVQAIEPQNPDALYLQALLALRANKVPLAKELLARMGEKINALPRAMLLDGIVQYRSGNNERAIAQLRAVLRLLPNDVMARRALATALWRAKDPAGVVETLRPVVARSDTDPALLRLMSQALRAIGDQPSATRFAVRAAGGSSPAGQRVRQSLDLMRALARKDKRPEILAEARRLATALPSAPEAKVLLGDAQMLNGDARAASISYAQAYQDTRAERVGVRYAEALRKIGDSEGSRRVLAEVVTRTPSASLARRAAGNLAVREGRWADAVTLLKPLAGPTSRDAASLNNLAWSLANLGKMSSALPLAERAYRLSPTNAAVIDTYGWLLYKSGRDPVRARTLLTEAVRLGPADPNIQAHLARAIAG